MTQNSRVSLGDTVKDQITGYQGVVVSRHEYLHGCTRYCVQSPEMKDGVPVADLIFDEQRLVVDRTVPNVLETIPRTNTPGGERPVPRRPAVPTY